MRPGLWGLDTAQQQRRTQIAGRQRIRGLLVERRAVPMNSLLEMLTKLLGRSCALSTRAFQIYLAGPREGINGHWETKGKSLRLGLPCPVRLECQLVVTGRKVLVHFSSGKLGPKGVKGLDRPRVISGIVEAEAGLKRRGPVGNLAQGGAERLGPFLGCWTDGLGVNALAPRRIQGPRPVRKKVHPLICRHNGLGSKPSHGGIEDTLPIRLYFPGQDMLSRPHTPVEFIEQGLQLR